MIAILPPLVAWLVAGVLAQPANCQATGTLRLDPPAAGPGEQARLIAEVDSPDVACRALVRSEPFVILRSPAGESELMLEPDQDGFASELTVPPPPWSATLYVVGTGAPLASVGAAGVTSLGDLWPVIQRAPGALLVIALAVGLGIAAVLGLPAPPPRRRGGGRFVRRLRLRSARQSPPPTAEGRPEVTGAAGAVIDGLATPAPLTAEIAGPAEGNDVGSHETANGEQGEDDANRRRTVVRDVGGNREDDGEEHKLARPTQATPE